MPDIFYYAETTKHDMISELINFTRQNTKAQAIMRLP